MEDEPINQNYLIGCDTIENSPSRTLKYLDFLDTQLAMVNKAMVG